MKLGWEWKPDGSVVDCYGARMRIVNGKRKINDAIDTEERDRRTALHPTASLGLKRTSARRSQRELRRPTVFNELPREVDRLPR